MRLLHGVGVGFAIWHRQTAISMGRSVRRPFRARRFHLCRGGRDSARAMPQPRRPSRTRRQKREPGPCRLMQRRSKPAVRVRSGRRFAARNRPGFGRVFRLPPLKNSAPSCRHRNELCGSRPEVRMVPLRPSFLKDQRGLEDLNTPQQLRCTYWFAPRPQACRKASDFSSGKAAMSGSLKISEGRATGIQLGH